MTIINYLCGIIICYLLLLIMGVSDGGFKDRTRRETINGLIISIFWPFLLVLLIPFGIIEVLNEKSSLRFKKWLNKPSKL